MKNLSFSILLTISGFAYGETESWVLSADEWARPRNGEAVTMMPPLPTVISKWSDADGRRLIIRYPGGEEGLLWAHELRSWLVALGVPLADQELVAGSHQADRIEIELTR